jgi:dihydroorotate dehydrogenase (NAD+) catalytic subunit
MLSALPDHLPRYDIRESYQWNYDHAPEPVEVAVPEVPGSWSFCGLNVPSPLGMPAGPLLNGKWVLYYASLGFDVLTYKTTRSGKRACYPLPNLQPVATGQLTGAEQTLSALEDMQGSWAVSFGMPSASPDVWRADVEWTRQHLPQEKLLSVSVVGTVQPDWSLEQLAADYAQCAKWAIDSGADCIETNFSCPNVATCDGQLYQNPQDAALVAQTVREAIPPVPYIAKIGHVRDAEAAEELLEALAPFVDALAMTNSVAALVQDSEGELLFDGQRRGICGEATHAASVSQTALFVRLIASRGERIRIIGVGGASTAEHVREYLDAGAESVQIATAAMIDPAVGLKIRRELAESTR